MLLKQGAWNLERLQNRFPEGEMLGRVRAVGVCGSDLHQYHGTHSWHVNYPVVLGHEFAGVIEAVGEGVQG